MLKCIRCGAKLETGRGAYLWRLEFTAIGEDVQQPFEAFGDIESYRTRLLQELADLRAEEIENDVYQKIEAVLCRPCRLELGKFISWFLMQDD